jgi:paraquat-inducible protein A
MSVDSAATATPDASQQADLIPQDAWIGCLHCDALQRPVSLPEGGSAHCYRCGAGLYRAPRDGINRAAACSMAALILFLVANAFPVLELQLAGTGTQTTLFGAVAALIQQGMESVAGLVFLTTIAFPLLQLLGMCALLVPVALGRSMTYQPELFRLIHTLRPWAMVEVFLLGTLVALSKLGKLATAVPGIALWSLCAMVLVSAAAYASFDAHQLWARLGQRR